MEYRDETGLKMKCLYPANCSKKWTLSVLTKKVCPSVNVRFLQEQMS